MRNSRLSFEEFCNFIQTQPIIRLKFNKDSDGSVRVEVSCLFSWLWTGEEKFPFVVIVEDEYNPRLDGNKLTGQITAYLRDEALVVLSTWYEYSLEHTPQWLRDEGVVSVWCEEGEIKDLEIDDLTILALITRIKLTTFKCPGFYYSRLVLRKKLDEHFFSSAH